MEYTTKCVLLILTTIKLQLLSAKYLIELVIPTHTLALQGPTFKPQPIFKPLVHFFTCRSNCLPSVDRFLMKANNEHLLTPGLVDPTLLVEPLTEERAARTLYRIELLRKIREQVKNFEERNLHSPLL